MSRTSPRHSAQNSICSAAITYTWKRISDVDIVSSGDETQIAALVEAERLERHAYIKKELNKAMVSTITCLKRRCGVA